MGRRRLRQMFGWKTRGFDIPIDKWTWRWTDRRMDGRTGIWIDEWTKFILCWRCTSYSKHKELSFILIRFKVKNISIYGSHNVASLRSFKVAVIHFLFLAHQASDILLSSVAAVAFSVCLLVQLVKHHTLCNKLFSDCENKRYVLLKANMINNNNSGLDRQLFWNV